MTATQTVETLCELTSLMLNASEDNQWKQVTEMDAQRRTVLEQFKQRNSVDSASTSSLDKLKQLDEQLKVNAARARDDAAGKLMALHQQESGRAAYLTTSQARG